MKKRKRFKYKVKRIGLKNRSVRFLALFITGALISGTGAIFAQYVSVEYFGWTETVYREEHSLPLKFYLNINVTNIPLYIDVYDGEEIKINYLSETALLIEENEYSYHISQDADFAFSFLSADILNYAMHVSLPNRQYREVNISTASGEVSIENVNSRYIETRSRSGNVYIGGAREAINLKSINGNIIISFVNYTENGFIESEAGDITVIMPNDSVVWLDYLTDTGKFTSDFFEKEYYEYSGGFFSANDIEPRKLSVKTVSGDLIFLTQ